MQVNTQLLVDALQRIKKHALAPWIMATGSSMKVTIFPEGGAGMRVTTLSIVYKGPDICFEVSDAMRVFLLRLLPFHELKISINIAEKSGIVIAESATTALQYTFPKINIIDGQVIEPHEDDVNCEIITKEWIALWNSVPQKGTVDIECSHRYRPITLKHSKGRWGAAINAKETLKHTKKFVCDSGVARSVIHSKQELPTFSILTFMQCGVLQWVAGPITVYLAPMV
jgi:hypothetical protein